MAKAPKGFTPDQVLAVYSFACGVSGEDLPRAARIMREIKALPRFYSAKNGNIGIKKADHEIAENEIDELYIDMKPTDLPAIWKWIKEQAIGNKRAPITAAQLYGLEDIAKALGQADDFATVLDDMTKETEDEVTPFPKPEEAK